MEERATSKQASKRASERARELAQLASRPAKRRVERQPQEPKRLNRGLQMVQFLSLIQFNSIVERRCATRQRAHPFDRQRNRQLAGAMSTEFINFVCLRASRLAGPILEPLLRGARFVSVAPSLGRNSAQTMTNMQARTRMRSRQFECDAPGSASKRIQ